MPTSDDMLVIGKISGVYGVSGWVKVFSYTAPRINIVNYDPWQLVVQGKCSEFNLSQGRSQGKTIVAKLTGVENPEQARQLIGSEIRIKEDQLKALAQDDYYWRDLEGLTVINTHGLVLGQVSHLLETGANDVLVVKLPAERAALLKMKELMIPYLFGTVIKRVDLENQQIEVDWDDEY